VQAGLELTVRYVYIPEMFGKVAVPLISKVYIELDVVATAP